MENNANVHERKILDILHKIDEEKFKELFDRASELKEAEKKEPINGVLYAAACGIKNSEKEQPLADELEEEMIAWHKEHFKGKRNWEETSGEYLTRESQLDIARHFVQWQKEKTKGKKWIFEDEYHKDMERSFQDGRDEMREQMLKEAVDGVIYGDVRSQEDQPYQIYAESDYLPMDKFKQYDKVKLIVIKED